MRSSGVFFLRFFAVEAAGGRVAILTTKAELGREDPTRPMSWTEPHAPRPSSRPTLQGLDGGPMRMPVGPAALLLVLAMVPFAFFVCRIGSGTVSANSASSR